MSKVDFQRFKVGSDANEPLKDIIEGIDVLILNEVERNSMRLFKEI
jgi:hypothetical protein